MENSSRNCENANHAHAGYLAGVACTRGILRRAGSLALLALALTGFVLPVGAADAKPSEDPAAIREGAVVIFPIRHATLVMVWKDKAIYVDPVGETKLFKGLPRPELILITDIHEDHLSAETIASVLLPKTKIIAPAAVAEKLPEKLKLQTLIMTNGESQTRSEITIEAVPMYNLTEDRLKFHEKGRGNGYVITAGEKRMYVSGDTEDIPEMRHLKNIDAAFVCMNLPFTMTVDQAASAVREFKPKIVCPYHYQGSDLEKFKQLVGEDSGIEVRLRDWYK